MTMTRGVYYTAAESSSTSRQQSEYETVTPKKIGVRIPARGGAGSSNYGTPNTTASYSKKQQQQLSGTKVRFEYIYRLLLLVTLLYISSFCSFHSRDVYFLSYLSFALLHIILYYIIFLSAVNRPLFLII